MGQFFNLQDLGAIAPELELMLFGMILLIADLLVENKKWLGFIGLGGIAWSGYFLIRLYGIQPVFAYSGSLIIDQFSWLFKLLFLIAAALTIFISMRYLDIEREHHGEYYALIMFTTMGMMFMAGAMDLITCISAWRPWRLQRTYWSDFCAGTSAPMKLR
jgi:NADH-quinone oxidoreductase subunit N